MKKLCAALVVVAVLGAVAAFAWFKAGPTQGVGVLPEQQAGLSQQPQRYSGPGRAQPATVQPPASAAQEARVAAAQQQLASREPQARLRERYSVQRARRVERFTRQMQQLEQDRESARKAGNTTDVAILDKLLARQLARIKQLQAASAQP